MLTGVPEINQLELLSTYEYGIESGANILVIGPSGGGKTEIGFQAISKKNCEAIYINMAVLERTDFQGMPVISDDKVSVSYATANFLPFSDISFKSAKDALDIMLGWVSKQKNKDKKEEATKLLNNEIKKLEAEEELKSLKNASKYLPIDSELYKDINKIENKKDDSKKIVFYFDEVDKALPEVLQTLLEFLQFHSINGRKLPIKCCFLTGNMPDEFAHVNQISHAITKRCLTFKLKIEFDIWKNWAIKNGISHIITGFLTQHNDWLYKKAPDNDDTAYALPSPRTWTGASKVIKYSEENEDLFKSEYGQTLKTKLLAGCIGNDAAVQLNVWFEHYHKLDPYINALIEEGTHPTKTKPNMNTEEMFICALSACAKIESALKPDNEKKYKKYIINTFKWLKTVPSDIQIGSIRMVFGGNFDSSKGHEGIIYKYKLAEIPEFVEVFIDINKNIQEWEKLNASGSTNVSDQ